MPVFEKKVEKSQTAICESVEELDTVKGKRKMYRMSLNGVSFEIWESRYFAGVPGQMYIPVVSVKPRTYTGRDGKTRAENACVVNWVSA